MKQVIILSTVLVLTGCVWEDGIFREGRDDQRRAAISEVLEVRLNHIEMRQTEIKRQLDEILILAHPTTRRR